MSSQVETESDIINQQLDHLKGETCPFRYLNEVVRTIEEISQKQKQNQEEAS